MGNLFAPTGLDGHALLKTHHGPQIAVGKARSFIRRGDLTTVPAILLNGKGVL